MTNTTLTSKTKAAIKARDGHTCMYCGTTTAPMEVDHVTPESWYADGTVSGDPHRASNLVCACTFCNNQKANMNLSTYAFFLRQKYGISKTATDAMKARVNAARRSPLP